MKTNLKILIILLCVPLFSLNISAQKKKIACIGNSITEGVGVTFHRAQAYPAVLQAYLGDEDYEVMNFGVSGHTMFRKSNAPYWNTQEYQNALAYKPDIVIIKLGTNDSYEYLWNTYKSEFKSDYTDFMNSFKAVNSETKFYLCYPVPIFPETGNQSKVLVNEVIPAIAEIASQAGATTIDLNTPFKGTRNTYFSDDLHPNVMGARRMVFLIAPYIFPAFDKQEDDVISISYVLPFDRTDKAVQLASSVDGLNVNALFDNDAATLLTTAFQNDMYFEVTLPEKTKITSYALTAGEITESPKSWELQAFWNNSWVKVNEQKNITFQAKETKLFEIPFSNHSSILNATNYRLVIKETSGNTNLSLAEFQLFGTPSLFEDAFTSNGGQITDQYGLNGHQGVQYLIDKKADTKYCAVEKGYTYWIQYQSPEPIKVEKYTLTTAEDVPDRDPTNWALEASNNGVDWDTLDTQYCRYFMSRYSTLEFPVNSGKEYTYFRLNISRLRHGKTFQLAEWQLLGNVIPKIKVACIGNSITEGIGVSNANDAYPAILQKNLGNEYEVRNFGASGRLMTKEPPVDAGWSYWTHPRYQESLDWEPDIVIIKLGTNDSRDDNWAKCKNQFKTDYKDMVRSYKELASNPKVYTCLPLPISPSTYVGSEVNLTTAIIPQIQEISSEMNTTIIDLHTPLVGKGYMTPDGCHPNKKGTTYMAYIVAKALCPDCELPDLPSDLFLSLNSTDQTDKHTALDSSGEIADLVPLIDNNPETAVNIAFVQGNETWVSLELENSTKITAYSITSDLTENSPKSWELQGATSTGNWVKMDEQKDIAFLPAETKIFDGYYSSYSALGAYTKFRLLIKENNGADHVGIKEWQLFGSTPTVENSICSNGGNITDKLNKNDGQGPQCLIDRNLSSKYCTAHLGTGVPYWIQYESTVASAINRYALTSAEDAPERDPVDWILEGSETGADWVVLDEQTGQEFVGRYSTLEYPVNNNTQCKYFKLTITKLKDGNMLQFSEWQLFPKISSTLSTINTLNYEVYSANKVITIKTGKDTLQYMIHNISGQCVETGNIAPYNEIQRNYPPGMYFISGISVSEKKVTKIQVGF